jgi:preprotein translocase subunit YajC
MDWLLLLAEGDQGGFESLMKSGLVPILLFFVVMMIFMSRSSARQRREQEARLAALKKNDKVITSAGILGTVFAINDNEVTLKVDETSNTRIRVLKSSIMQVNPDETAQQQAQPQTQQPQQPTT